MRKLFTCLLIITVFIACERRIISKPNFELEIYLDSIKTNNKNWRSNTALRENINKEIKKDLVIKINKGLFDKYPLQLEKIYECNGKYILEFNNYYLLNEYKKNPIKYNINDIRFYLLGNVSKNIAFNLQENKIYNVKFKFENYIDVKNMNKYCKHFLMSPFIGLDSGIGVTKDVDFGSIAIKIDSVNLYNDTL